MQSINLIQNDTSGFVHHYLENVRQQIENTQGEEISRKWCYEATKIFKHHFVFFKYDYFAANDFNQWALIEKYKQRGKAVVFDIVEEGYSPVDIPIITMMHNALETFGIEYDQIYFVSGNLLEEDLYKNFCKKHNIKERMKVVPLCMWDAMAYFNIGGDENKFLDNRLEVLEERFTHYFINLNRRIRPHRSWFTSKLFDMPEHWRQISHDAIEDPQRYKNFLMQNACPDDKAEKAKQILSENCPLIVDTDRFDINWANSDLEELHLESLFSVVSETWQQDWNKTSMFFSEKTFRPMKLGQPFLIYGQQNCHKYLEKMGYELYTEIFDYDFDRIADDYERGESLYNEVIRVCNKLDEMTKSEKVSTFKMLEPKIRRNLHRMKMPKWSKIQVPRLFTHPLLQALNDEYDVKL